MTSQAGLDLKHILNDQCFKQSVLFEACALKDEEKSLRLCKFFLQQGVLATTADDLKQIPLYYAVREGHRQVVELLVKEGSNVNHVDTYGQTPIFYCIREGDIQTTQLLVSH